MFKIVEVVKCEGTKHVLHIVVMAYLEQASNLQGSHGQTLTFWQLMCATPLVLVPRLYPRQLVGVP